MSTNLEAREYHSFVSNYYSKLHFIYIGIFTILKIRPTLHFLQSWSLSHW